MSRWLSEDPLWDRELLGVATHRKVVRSGDVEAFSLQWVLHTAAGVATINLYGSSAPLDYLTGDTNPATNPRWQPLPGLAFASQPVGAIDASVPLERAEHALTAVLVEVVVATQLDEFSLYYAGREA